MITKKSVETYEEFVKLLSELPETGPKVVFLFSGAKNENGRSWCIYCQMAEPIVDAFLSELTENIIFVHVNVGTREFWKDKNCPFRTDSRTRLLVIPTLIRWKGVQRLEGTQCNNRDLLQMLFSSEE